ITYPNGGEGFVPGETERIHWDAFGNTGNFTLKYSTDNGNSWSNITTNVAGDLRLYEWTVPNTVSGEVLINVSRGSLSDTSDYTCSIVGLPQNISFSRLCPDTLLVSWDAVPGATGYDVFKLGNQYMDSIGSSATNSFKLPNFIIPSSDDWFAARAKGTNGLRGRRSIAAQLISLPNCFDIGVSQLGEETDFSVLSSCFLDTSYISIIIKNHSLSTISGFDVSYQINNGAIITETFSGLLPPLDSTVYQFSTPELLPTGTNTIVSWTSLANDELLANDTTSNQVLISNQPTLVAPFTEDFEGQSNCGTSSNCGNEICNLTGGWVNAINFTMDDIDWRVDNGGTPSTATGPSIDHNPGTLSGKYLYTEASNGCEGQQAELYSPCIDVGGMLNPILSFWYHMDGGDMGELHVDILDGNQLYLDVILPLSGDKGPLWLEGQVPLAPYDSLIQIRFRGITGNGFNSDLAIDDISIQDFAQAPMTDFTADKTSTCTGELVSFTDLSTLGPISHNWIITPQVIYTNNTDSTSADPFVIFPVSGFYQVTLITTNAFGSDTTTKVNYIEASDGNPIPFTEDFQAAGFPPADWIVENPDGAFTWEERNVVGATGTTTAAAYVNNFSYNGAGEEDFLISFPIDLTTAVNPILTFDVAYVRYDAGYEDELRIDLSDDCGDTYN
ncbi:MAG: hypothetical protein KDD99_28980, partial [Bacteroidetes bacterium]|nr:hypothetical protein [Bacteroidota bacterium]